MIGASKDLLESPLSWHKTIETKICYRCLVSKPTTAFNRNRSKRDGLQAACRSCDKLLHKTNYNYDRKRHQLMSKLSRRKCSLTKFEAMKKKQKNRCAICRRPERKINKTTGKAISLSIDHNHATGQIRGLLCWSCNLVIGHMNDEPELLRKAIEYLETSKCSVRRKTCSKTI